MATSFNVPLTKQGWNIKSVHTTFISTYYDSVIKSSIKLLKVLFLILEDW